jgi:hypothetical protein
VVDKTFPTTVTGPSEDFTRYPVIVDPPVAGAVQDTVSKLTPVVAVGAFGAAGTVVANTPADAEDAADVPAALVAVTVNVYVVFDRRPVTVIGEAEELAVNPPGEDVTVYDVAAGESPGNEKLTLMAPLSNAREVPTFVPTTDTGGFGSSESFCCKDLDPSSFFAIFYFSNFLCIFLCCEISNNNPRVCCSLH